MFPSAVSRYLVSNLSWQTLPTTLLSCFHPLYRGTWFPTMGRQVPEVNFTSFPSAVSRYLVSNEVLPVLPVAVARLFPSAVSRYLVSNSSGNSWLISCFPFVSIRCIAVLGFQLWERILSTFRSQKVSIRCIAVLGFQQEGKGGMRIEFMFPSAVSRYLVSNKGGDASSHTGLTVSIRCIAVLGFQRGV